MLTINMKNNSEKDKKEEDAFLHSIPFPSNTATVKAWTYQTEEEVNSFLSDLWLY